MSKHTAGPWVLHPRFPECIVPAGEVGKPIGFHVDHALDRAQFAHVVVRVEAEHRYRGADQLKANARLIAAAPELYAALDELEDAFDEQLYQERSREELDAPDDREYSVNITAKQLRAITRALSKAEHGS